MAEATIYTGLWIGWSKGRFLGATLKTTAVQGRFLVAFVAVFVSTAGGSLWQIINYGIHRSRSTDEAHVSLPYFVECSAIWAFATHYQLLKCAN